MLKRYALAALVCVNLVLLTGIVLVSAAPPAALAQEAPAAASPGLASNYLIVTGNIQSDFDGVYVIDRSRQLLHGFYWERGRNRLLYAGSRDLEVDFRNR